MERREEWLEREGLEWFVLKERMVWGASGFQCFELCPPSEGLLKL
jgi:hypothetical protein